MSIFSQIRSILGKNEQEESAATPDKAKKVDAASMTATPGAPVERRSRKRINTHKGRRILIIDDVITAGTAIREALAIIRDAGGIPAGIVVALDRQEIASETDRRSAAQAVAAETGIPVIAVATLDDLMAFLRTRPDFKDYEVAVANYRQAYGVSAQS